MARLLLLAAVALTMVVAATASCPNQCSGHGTCGTNDLCTCYKQEGSYWDSRVGWVGADCSLRTCPTAIAWDRISTQASRVFAYKFTAIDGTDSRQDMQVFVSGTFAGTEDKNFMVRISQVNDTSNIEDNVYEYEWKYDTETYWQAEQTMRRYQYEAQDLGNSGVRVYFPNRDTASKYKSGDLYEFTASHNDGVDFDDRDDNTSHQNQECAGRGSCDRKTGECVCDVGYGGEACARTLCPADCSGHGVCQALYRFAADAGAEYDTAWDQNKHMGCKCDGGYRGPDCSLKECPSGADPLGADGGAQGRDCSGRGVCDYSNGLCACFRGYFGERCEYQTNFV